MAAGDVLGLPCNKGMRPSVKLSTLGAGAAETSLPRGSVREGQSRMIEHPDLGGYKGRCSMDDGSDI